MVKRTMTKKEAVEKYGNDKQKEHFNKYGRFVSQNIEKSLIKEIQRYYSSVEKVKQGRSIVYELDGKRKEPLPKVDSRISNGSWSNPYTKNMDIVVVSKLEQGNISPEAKTMSNWLLEFGLINESMYELLQSANNSSLLEEHTHKLLDNCIINEGEEKIIDDFRNDIKYLKRQLTSALERMRKSNIIEFYMIPKAVTFFGEVIDLDEVIFNNLVTIKRELMEKYDLDEWTINTLRNSKNVQKYNEELMKKFSKVKNKNGDLVSISYFYKTHAIILKARKKKIIKYLEKYNQEAIEQFKKDKSKFIDQNVEGYQDNRDEYVYKKAQEREDKFLENIESDLNSLPNGIWGEGYEEKKKKYNNFLTFYDPEYYQLYLNREYARTIKMLQNYYRHEFGEEL